MGRAPTPVDAWRMVAARREFEGRSPLARMQRLRDLLLEPEAGDVRYRASFGTDACKVPFLELVVDAQLPLLCQRSLQRFLLPVRIEQRLGLIRDEADEAALPPGYEALLVPGDGLLSLEDVVEDELILAVPVVPVDPQTQAVERESAPAAEEQAQASPFAALAGLKSKQ